MYLLDTNTVIDFFNAKLPEAGKLFLMSIDEPKISVITRIELFSSAKILTDERLRLEAFAKQIKVYDHLNIDIINHTILIRQTHKTKLPDAIIAATALAYNLTIVSRNVVDFQHIDGLRVINPHNF